MLYLMLLIELQPCPLLSFLVQVINTQLQLIMWASIVLYFNYSKSLVNLFQIICLLLCAE